VNCNRIEIGDVMILHWGSIKIWPHDSVV